MPAPDRRRPVTRRLPRTPAGLAGLAGLACLACCLIPILQPPESSAAPAG